MKTIIFISALLLFVQNAVAIGDVSSEYLVKDSVSWDGSPYEYVKGTPQITVQKININPGDNSLSLAVHCHTIPLAAYVLKGSVQVVRLSGENTTFRAGEAFIEVMNIWHKGIFTEETELIVFYAGIKGVDLAIKKDAQSSAGACKLT